MTYDLIGNKSGGKGKERRERTYCLFDLNNLLIQFWVGACRLQNFQYKNKKSKNVLPLHIELDSRVLFYLIWGSSEHNLLIDSIVENCRKTCCGFREVMEARHIYREASGVADSLASHARQMLEGSNLSGLLIILSMN